jgi:GNAT superfamily N-acetyltransferase
VSQTILIRDYTPEDKADVLQLLQKNTPAYFSTEEEADFLHYLEKELEYYYVLLSENEIVGAGGINFSGNPAIGKISWDLIHPDHQGKGFGKRLLHYRLDKLRSMPEVEQITVRTSQLVCKFYERAGFHLAEVVKDYWAPGFDLYRMKYVDDQRFCL